MSLFYFDKETLERLAKEKGGAYRSAEPFPHGVFDGLVPQAVLDEVLKEFPGPRDIAWNEFHEATQNKKLSCEDENKMGPTTRHLLNQFNSSTFLRFLEELTGIERLISDPHFRGGGLHQTLPGGSLGMHADFNFYKKLKLYRRINIIFYLNKDWKEEYGGHLELWDKGMTHCVEKVLPVYNRAVIFNTDHDSNHGQPEPLTCPEGNSRKSLALYYYTVDSPSGSSEKPHTTLFRKRPGQDVDFKEEPTLMGRIVRKAKKLLS